MPARIESRFALYESSMSVRSVPSTRSSCTSMRCGLSARARERTLATVSRPTPRVSAPAAAASAFATWWRPTIFSSTGASPSGVTSVKDARSARSRRTSRAMTSARSLPEAEKRITRPVANGAMASTFGSSVLRITGPPGRVPLMSSAFAAATPSKPPKPPTWARPTHSSMATSGATMSVR